MASKKVQFKEVLTENVPKQSLQHVASAADDDNSSGCSVCDDSSLSSDDDSQNEEESKGENKSVRMGSFGDSSHGEERRKERQISKADLETAMAYGTKQDGLNGRVIYKYEGLTFVYDERTGQEVTSWTRPDSLHTVRISAPTQQANDEAFEAINEDRTKWRSNTVVVVDTSGSMKLGDVDGARTRLKAVWISMAVDFIAHGLETGDKNDHDLVSVVLLGENTRVLWDKQPWSWILYNKIVRLYCDGVDDTGICVLPRGHGPFIPSLICAEDALAGTPGHCALGLAFFSDGAPSDHFLNGGRYSTWVSLIAKKIGNISASFGSRLSFTAVAVGANRRTDFEALRMMVLEAKEYGAKAELVFPTMSVVGIGGAFTTLATSLTATQLALADSGPFAQRHVRGLQRESKFLAMQSISKIRTSCFDVFEASMVQRQCYRHSLVNRKFHSETIDVPLHPNVRYVAMCKKPFGEGAERFAFRFYEIGADGVSIIGPPMVAKESRYVAEHGQDWKARRRYIKKFCKTQQWARYHGQRFNEKMESFSCIHTATPRIQFLDCSMYNLNSGGQNSKCVLVENMLIGHQWQKWNSNDGSILTETKETHTALRALRRRSLDVSTAPITTGPGVKVLFTDDEVAQAFSHFTYYDSGRRRLVCDLQGVYKKDERLLLLSDPVIHYHRYGRESRPHRHGQTDHGRVGIQCFQELAGNMIYTDFLLVYLVCR